jgi:hypothetical protein
MADRKRQDRERWLVAVLQSIAYGVVATDEQWRIRFMNRAAESLAGWRADQAMGREPGRSIARIDFVITAARRRSGRIAWRQGRGRFGLSRWNGDSYRGEQYDNSRSPSAGNWVRGDDPCNVAQVGLHWIGAADTDEAPRFKEAQQHALRRPRQVLQLIEKKRAPARRVEKTDVRLAVRAGKGPPGA